VVAGLCHCVNPEVVEPVVEDAELDPAHSVAPSSPLKRVLASHWVAVLM
jgi:hypothetical protein